MAAPGWKARGYAMKRAGSEGKTLARFAGWLGALVCVLGLCPSGARAYDDPVVRTVRLSYLQGSVTVLRADNTGGDPAQLNMPLTEGQRITTSDDGQAEVEFEDGSLLRISPRSSVLLSRLAVLPDGGSETQVDLLSGLIYAELRATPRYVYRVNAGGDTVTPVTNATVRVTLDQAPAEVAVMDGTAHVERTGGGYRVDVSRGESLRGDGADGSRYFLSQQIEHNSWDDWNEEREQAAANELAARTAARDGFAGDQGFGWSDLDANGTWYDTGQGGPVWQPFDAGVSGFDPYGYGSWVYVSGPGYVWSSGYRWGWTPFRCGSWNYWQDFGWGWRPAGSCGAGGWGYGSGPGRVGHVNRINLSSVPPGYKRPLPPVPGGPVRVHPIVPVRTGPPPVTDRGLAYQAREIAGRTAMPLRTTGSSYTPRGGSAVGSSLRRDFPVDRATKQPVLGTVRVPNGRRGPDASEAGATAPVGAARPGGNGGRPGEDATRGTAAGFDRRRGAEDGGLRPSYPGRNGVAPAAAAGTPFGGVRVHPGDRNEGGPALNQVPAPLNSVPAPLNTTPAPLNSVPAPLNSTPAPLNTVPRVPSSERSVPVLPPGQRLAPVQPVPSQRSYPSPPPPPVRSAPAPAPAVTAPAAVPKR